MNLQLTNEQKHTIVGLVLGFILALASAFGYSQINPAKPASTITAESFGASVQDPATFKSLTDAGDFTFRSNQSRIIPGPTSFAIRNPANTQDNFLMDPSGNITVSGSISLTGSYVGITPVATATAMPTPTILASVGSLAVTTSVSVQGTPVVPFATPQTLFIGSSAANVYQKCNDSAAVTGTLTATPVAGATPIGQPWASLAQAPTGDAARAYASYTAGTFTVGVTNTALTPAPNTTPAAVKWCYQYSK